jgi:predicted nucleic-acid-binding protein
VKLTADTNVLIRAAVQDDLKQARAAMQLLGDAELVAVAIPSLCEFVWVLESVYGLGWQDISNSLEGLLNAANVVVNRAAADAGLAALKAGGDFADAAIAQEASLLGGEVFVSFDEQAVTLLAKQGHQTSLLR